MLADQSPWENVHQDLAIYRYQVRPSPTQPIILLLHGPMTTHRGWDMLASYLGAKGLRNLYAVDIQPMLISNPLHRQAVEYLERVLHALGENYSPQTRVILIGHSTGGVLARRFLYKSRLASSVQYLFTLASPHHQTRFTHSIYTPSTDDSDPGNLNDARILPNPPHLSDTYMINFYGNALGVDFDGTIRGTALPEAMNRIFPLRHGQFKQHETVFSEILAYLRGERYRLQIYLEYLHLREEAEHLLGQLSSFCFEINRVRVPGDGFFRPQPGVAYTFTDAYTPLVSLPFTPAEAFVSVIVRLQDLSRRRSAKRRLFVTLLVSLGVYKDVLYEVQDSQGADVGLRVKVQQMPKVIG